jgi:hypothetical protein
MKMKCIRFNNRYEDGATRLRGNYIYVFLILPLFQCFAFSTASDEIPDSKILIERSDSLVASDTLDCLHIVARIVWGSGFNNEDANKKLDKSKTTVYIDNINVGVIKIKVTYKGTPSKVAEPSNDSEFPIGWLELDLNKNELRDITIDPDSPFQLSFDKTMLPLLKRICIKQ